MIPQKQLLSKFKLENPRSHRTTIILSIHIHYVSYQSDHQLLKYNNFKIWPWKSKTSISSHRWSQVLGWIMDPIYDSHSFQHNDVIMGAIASQITSLAIVHSSVYSDADKRKHQSSASLAFMRGTHRRPVNSPHKWPVTRKMLPFDDVIISCSPCHSAFSFLKYDYLKLWTWYSRFNMRGDVKGQGRTKILLQMLK